MWNASRKKKNEKKRITQPMPCHERDLAQVDGGCR